MSSRKRKSGRDRMLRLALLTAISHAIVISCVETNGAQKRKAKLRGTESLSYETTVAQLDSLSPVDREDSSLLWQYRNWHFDRCTLWFKDRLVVSSRPRDWLYTKVWLPDLNENSIQLERQGKDGVGLRIVTDGFREKITRYHENGDPPVIIGQYYINFGSSRRAEKVRSLLRHAIQLCKAKQEETNTFEAVIKG